MDPPMRKLSATCSLWLKVSLASSWKLLVSRQCALLLLRLQRHRWCKQSKASLRLNLQNHRPLKRLQGRRGNQRLYPVWWVTNIPEGNSFKCDQNPRPSQWLWRGCGQLRNNYPWQRKWWRQRRNKSLSRVLRWRQIMRVGSTLMGLQISDH